MKRCTKCGEVKPLDAFHKNMHSKNGRAWRCRGCSQEDRQRWYAINSEKAKNDARTWRKNNPERSKETHHAYYAANREKVLLAQRKLWEANHRNLREKFGLLCLDCGQKFPMGMFEYHHLDPDTKTENTNLRGWKWARLEAYVIGCVQLCPNCHRLRHRSKWEISWKEREAAN